jgi:hypothetical protein
MKNRIWYDKRLTGRIKTATIVLLFLISVSTLTSMVHAQSNPSSVQSLKDIKVSSNASKSNKSFYLFTDEIEGINETKLGIPADYYIPNIL